MAVDEDWEQVASTPAIAGIDEQGRLVAGGTMDFTCPECGTEYEIGIKLPLPLNAGDLDGD
jgi:hypothetical protein